MRRRSGSFLVLLTTVTVLAGLPALAPRPAAAVGTADLAVNIIGDAKHLKFGETITFTTTVTNLGPDEATGVTLGIGVSDSYADFGGTCPDGSISTFCELGTLALDESVTVLFRAGACCSCCPNRLGVAVASVFHDVDTIDPVYANDWVRIDTRFTGKAPF